MVKRVSKINIVIGRFGEEPRKMEVGKDCLVRDALNQAGISLSSGEKVWVGGDKADLQDILEEGDIINIVGAREGGVK